MLSEDECLLGDIADSDGVCNVVGLEGVDSCGGGDEARRDYGHAVEDIIGGAFLEVVVEVTRR